MDTNIIELATANSDWAAIELSKPYWHEAGHAVIARLIGFPVAWVSVDQKFIRSNDLAIKNESSECPAVCMTISSDRLTPILEKRSILSKKEKETVVGYCMHVLAGPYVEECLDPESFNPDLSVRDYHQVGMVLRMVDPRFAGRKKLYVAARRRLKKMVNQNWDKIHLVADALFHRQTVMRDELDELLLATPLKVAA
ncbi:hypothetical protein [Ruegeria sp. HKCCD6157]|uniref:hypothetical protein n=1 Tax=Ruegeria sp. HKCCD6157 TaxID=2690707 RepID=UPI00149203E7|nr:hypothetical protein [Ruegeria sp. HKCCD6157]NOE24827.1 hypothetical protein [Ruegeria sp. HKCCD6157]